MCSYVSKVKTGRKWGEWGVSEKGTGKSSAVNPLTVLAKAVPRGQTLAIPTRAHLSEVVSHIKKIIQSIDTSWLMARPAGFEPATCGLEVRTSIIELICYVTLSNFVSNFCYFYL